MTFYVPFHWLLGTLKSRGSGLRESTCSDHRSFTTPRLSQLPPNWEDKCLNVIWRFYCDPYNVEQCLSEIRPLINRDGPWVKLIDRKQSLIEPTEAMTFTTFVDLAIWQEEQMLPTATDWDVSGKPQFPTPHVIAVRLALVEVYSADVKRLCKAHMMSQKNRLKAEKYYIFDSNLWDFFQLWNFFSKCDCLLIQI